MDWKEMTEQPPEGAFEKIERRLRVRRAMRIGLPSALLVIAAGAYLVFAHPAQAEDTAARGNDVALAVPEQSVVATTDDAGSPELSAVKKDESSHADAVDLAELMPETSPQVAQVQLPSTAGTFSVCGLPSWTGDSRVPQAEHDRILQETVDSLFSVEIEESQPDNSPLSALHPQPSSKAGEPQPEPYHEDDLLWAPDIITPNGDVDENRTFGIKASSTLSDFRIQIFNRRGQRIFYSTDPAFRWDATYNGSAVSQGGYVWIASFRDSEGKPRNVRGTVVVVR